MIQATSHKMQGWLVQCTFALILLLVLFGGLHAARAAAAAPADDGVAVPPARALPDAAYVNADGTLKTGVGAQASLDVSGWHVTLDPRRGPILAPRLNIQPEIQAGIHTAEQPKGWSPLGTGIGSTVKAIAISGTDVYVGGSFTSIPGCTGECKYIAKWDGTNWSGVGGGVNGAEVAAILIQGADVYVGGWFGQAGTCSPNCKNVAKWNGTEWSALGTGVNDEVFALALSGTDLYAGGRFTAAGLCTTPCQHIAKWDGTTWSALSTGTSDYVFALAAKGPDVYAGGRFTSTSGCTDTCGNIAKWDGTAWSPLGTGTNATVEAIAITGTEVYVGGSFYTAGSCSVKCNGIAKWDGTSWSGLNYGTGEVIAIALVGTDVYVGGRFNSVTGCATGCSGVAKWNGTAWAPLGTGVDKGPGGAVLAMAADSNAAFAGGVFIGAGSCTTADGCQNIARYGPPPGGLESAKTVTPQVDVAYGAMVTYTLVVTNSGAAAETDVHLSDVLPSQTHFGAWLENPGAAVTGDAITWQGEIAAASTITFAFTAANNAGASTSITNSAVISGSTQIITATAGYRTKAGSSTSLQSTANPVFVGDALGFTVTVGTLGTSSIGAASYAGPTGAVSVTDASGAIALAGTLANGQVLLAAPQLAAGTYTVTATYFGDSHFEGSVSPIVVQIVQRPATAINDAAGTAEDTPVAVPVLANDLGPVVGGLIVTALPVLPVHGTAAISLDQQTVIYTPTTGFSGYDSFTYTITDTYGNADSALATVVVTPKTQTSAPPQIAPVDPQAPAAKQFTSAQATVSVELPGGFFTGTVTAKDNLFLSYTPILTPTSQTGSPPGNLSFGGLQFDLSLFLNNQSQSGVQFAVPITLTIVYDPALLNGLSPATLAVYFWNGTAWSTDGIDVVSRDVPNHTITIAVHHLSDFAFFAAVPTGEETKPEPVLHQELFLPSLSK